LLGAHSLPSGHNAVVERFFATLKNEEATGVYATRAAAYAAITRYIHGFNKPARLHFALGICRPMTTPRR